MLTRAQFFSAMTRCAGVLVPAVIVGCAGAEGDPLRDVYEGEQARERIVSTSVKLNTRRDGGPLPASVTNFYMFDGGSFNGTIEYWSFQCGTLDDCWSALASVGGPDKVEFKEWVPSRFGLVMDGPGFYSAKLRTPLWDVRTIKNGVVYERVKGGNRKLQYYAVDFDRLRVYHHYESGGFPDTEYDPSK